MIADAAAILTHANMPAQIHIDTDNQVCQLQVTGSLKYQEYASCESELASYIDTGATPKLLVVLNGFEGWEPGEDWGSLDFVVTHSDRILKVAIVGAGAAEAEVKAFIGAGIRPRPVRFFADDEMAVARAWLVSEAK